MTQPSSQGPCICPENGVMQACPRHEHVCDWLGDWERKEHLRQHAWLNGVMPS